MPAKLPVHKLKKLKALRDEIKSDRQAAYASEDDMFDGPKIIELDEFVEYLDWVCSELDVILKE